MTWPRWPYGPPPVYRTVAVGDLLVTLRAALGLDPFDPAPGELAAWRGRAQPEVIERVDAGAWVGWSILGLPLLAGEGLPTIDRVHDEAHRFLLALGMERHGGNLTAVGRSIGRDRRAVRAHLQRLDLYDLDFRTSGYPLVTPRNDGRVIGPEGGGTHDQ